MKRFSRFTHLFALAALLVGGLAACDTSSSALSDDEALAPSDLNEMAATLATELDLSNEQARAVDALLGGDEKRAPGYLWNVAAELQETLTDTQKERLLERADQRPQRRMRRGGAEDGAGRFGQGRRPEARRHGLGDLLTDEQQATLREQMTARREAVKELAQARRDGTLSDEAFRAEMQTLREEMKASFEALLTADQKAALEQRRAEHEAKREEYKEAAEVARVEALGLSVEQEAALDALHETHRQAMREQFEAARSGDGDREAFREAFRAQMQELRAAHKAELAAVLTPVQLEVFEIHNALRAHVGKGRRGGPRKARGPRSGN